MVIGSITQEQEKFSVSTRDAGPVTVAKDAIVTIRNRDEQARCEVELDHLRNPRVLDRCSRSV